MSEITPFNRTKFVLLLDFWEAYRNFDLKQATSVPELDGIIRRDMAQALRQAACNVEFLEIDNIRRSANELFDGTEYIITLEGGVVFSNFSFSLDITRACPDMDRATTGPYLRVPRPLAPQLVQQVGNLKSHLSARSPRKIVLCDDGIGTGQTLKKMLNFLGQLNIKVDRIVTITNPDDIKTLEGIEVNTVFRSSEPYNWLNERDLFWGLPRSGLSIITDGTFIGLGGIPYTISDGMVTSRIGIHPSRATEFRYACLNANISFWKLLERFHGRDLTIRDCPRLRFLTKVFDQNESILNLINLCRTKDILNGVQDDK